MLKNYLKTLFLNLKKRRAFSFINILGLSIGLACCILIYLFVRDEWQTDRWHERGDRIHRVITVRDLGTDGSQSALTQAPLATALKSEFPEITAAACFNNTGFGLVKCGDDFFNPSSFQFTDPDFFRMFSFEFLRGDPDTALDDPHSIVLSQEVAERYYGDGNPMGEMIIVENHVSLKVTGVLKKHKNSHVSLNHVVSNQLYGEFGTDIETWNRLNYTTYILLDKNASSAELGRKIASYLDNVYGEDNRMELRLQPMKHIYLFSHYAYDVHARTSDFKVVMALGLIALFILIIACVNFMNLATARSEERMREVGMRKVLGARRAQLIQQFLGESIFMSFLALILGMGLVELVLRAFNNLSMKNLSLLQSPEPATILALLGITLLTGFLAGSYPAFFLSSFRPVQTVRGTVSIGKKGSLVRKILVIGQFAVSIVLIIATLVVFKQLRYMQSRNLGYNKEHLVALNLNPQFVDMYQAFTDELRQNTQVAGVTSTMNLPNWEWPGFMLEDWEGRTGDETVRIKHNSVDYDFFKAFGMKFAMGRAFKQDFPTDAEEALIVNEEAVRQMGMEDPLGKRIGMIGGGGRIVGVVRDFNFDSLRKKIDPLVIKLAPREVQYLVVRLRPGSPQEGIKVLRRTWDKFVTGYPFRFRFLDDVLNQNYRLEMALGRVFTVFTLLTVFVACMGLFGLASFMAERRTKEIGIRKVLGANVSGIVLMLSKDYTKWVLAANIAALPIAFFLARKLLEGYAYRTPLGLTIFLLPVVISLLAAVLTVSYQAFRAALTDPAQSIRYE